MNSLEYDESRYRIIVALASMLVAVMVVAILHFALPAPSTDEVGPNLSSILLGRDASGDSFYPVSIQNFMWVLFFVGVGELWVRFNRANAELNQLKNDFLPEDEDTLLNAKDLGEVRKRIGADKYSRFYFTQRLLSRVILQYQTTQTADQASNIMDSSLELMQHEADMKYSMLRYLVWLIPTVGFIGTVVGISGALGTVADMPDIALGGDAIKDWLGIMTSELGVAFNTTLLSLLMSSILVFVLHIVQNKEELALNSVGQYCLDNLINRLYEYDS